MSSQRCPTCQKDDTNFHPKCCECCTTKANGRNLILCFDGTSNQFGDKNTNVIELYSRIIKDDTQLTYYNSGIGTYARPSWYSYTYLTQLLDNNIDLAIAWNFKKVILAGYRWLSDNYVAGDKIFLFGFSRGAYQVRVLAGMIDKVGLILRGNEEQIPFAYELYADLSPKYESPKDKDPNKKAAASQKEGESSRKDGKSREKDVVPPREENSVKDEAKQSRGESSRKNKDVVQPKDGPQKDDSPPKDGDAPEQEKKTGKAEGSEETEGKDSRTKAQKKADKSSKRAARFKATFSRLGVKVHFLGLWDTVSSVGVIRGKNLPGTNDFDPDNICYFRHALALDERRVKFLPEYVRGGETYVDKGGNATPRVKEVWFAGCHSDIGGGNANNEELNNATVPVLWMGNEALFAGLKLAASKVEWDWKKLERTRPEESLKYVWLLFELMPFKRLSYGGRGSTWWPHLGKGRVIKPGQKIHASVSFINGYKPRARFSPNVTEGGWRSIVGKGQQGGSNWAKGIEHLLELDLFDYSKVNTIIEEVSRDPAGNQQLIDLLTFIASSREGAQAITQAKAGLPFLGNLLKDSDDANVVTGATILSKLATHDITRSAAMETSFIQSLVKTMTNKNSDIRISSVKAIRGLPKYDEIRCRMNLEGMVTLLITIIEHDQESNEAIRALHEFVRHSDGRDTFLNMVDPKSAFELLLKKLEIWKLLTISELFTDVADLKIIDHDSISKVTDNFQLLPPLKQLAGELFSDENNIASLCLLVEHGFYKKASTNEVIQFLIDTIGVQTFALDMLSALLKHEEVRKQVLEKSKDWIVSLRKMVVGSDQNKLHSGLQALSMFARYSEMREKILKTKITKHLVKLFSKTTNDAVKYCVSQALITLDGGNPQASIPAKDAINWMIESVGVKWRYRRTVKFLSEINSECQKNIMQQHKGIQNLAALTRLPGSIASTKVLVRPEEFSLRRLFFRLARDLVV